MDELEDQERAILRQPPHSKEAEEAVLGSLLIDAAAFDRAGDILERDDFYRLENRLVYEAIASLVMACKPVDPMTVFEQLERIKGGDAVPFRYLHDLSTSVLGGSNIRRYAEIVRERALSRRMISALDEAMTVVWRQEGTTQDRIDKISETLHKIEHSAASGNAPKLLADILVQRLDRLNDVNQGDKKDEVWPTCILGINKALGGGLRPGHVYVLAARPSVGKSSLAQVIGLALARDEALPVLMLSQEMPDAEVGDRAISMLGKVDFEKVQRADFNDIEWSLVSEAVEMGSRIPFYVDEQAGLRLPDIRLKSRMVPGLKVVVIDYLQLMASSEKDETNRNQQISEITAGVKTLAKKLGIAVIILSQLNREVERRSNPKPVMSDLRDSGSIEQDCDVAMLMWRVRRLGNEDVVGVTFGKNRQGKAGVELGFHFRGAYHAWDEDEALDLSSDGQRFSKRSGDNAERGME